MVETKVVESPLDYTDLLIAYGLARYSPRNIYKISRELGIPESTIRYRIKMMKKRNYLYLFTNIYHTNLGLKKLFLFAEVNPLYWDGALELFRVNGYWLFLSQILSNKPMIFGLYVVPYDNVPQAIEFFDEMVKLDIIKDYDLYHSTCFYRVNPNLKWYDAVKGGWIFEWGDILESIDYAPTNLPITLRDPDRFFNYADKTDVEILWRLELDATKSFSELAKELNTTPQNIRYHYNEHIMKRFLIEGYEIYIKKYVDNNVVYVYTVIDFTSREGMAKLANVFRNRPFTEVLGKILTMNSLLIYVNIPMSELVNYLRTLNTLVKLGYIRNYKYYVRMRGLKYVRQTIPHMLFGDGMWIYDHEGMLQELHEELGKHRREAYVRHPTN